MCKSHLNSLTRHKYIYILLARKLSNNVLLVLQFNLKNLHQVPTLCALPKVLRIQRRIGYSICLEFAHSLLGEANQGWTDEKIWHETSWGGRDDSCSSHAAGRLLRWDIQLGYREWAQSLLGKDMTPGKQKEQVSSPVRKKKMGANKLQWSGLRHKRKSEGKKGSRTRKYRWGNKNKASLEKESLMLIWHLAWPDVWIEGHLKMCWHYPLALLSVHDH